MSTMTELKRTYGINALIFVNRFSYCFFQYRYNNKFNSFCVCSDCPYAIENLKREHSPYCMICSLAINNYD